MYGAFSNFDSIPIKACVVTKLRNMNSYNLSKKDRNFLQTGLEEISSNPHKIVPSV
jgi:hypothetical protein